MSVIFFRQIKHVFQPNAAGDPARCFKCNEVKTFESHYFSAPPPNEETIDGSLEELRPPFYRIIRLFDAVQNSARAIIGLGEASGMAIEKLERKIELLETHAREHGKRIDAIIPHFLKDKIMIRLLNLEQDVAKLKAWREEEEKRLAEIVESPMSIALREGGISK